MKSLICTLANQKYIDKAKQLFSSVYYYGKWKGDYLLLAFNIMQEDAKWFRDRGINIFEVKPFDSSMDQKSQILFSKIELFRTFFKKWDRIVYLDTDMIVRSPINGLLNYDGLGGVQGLRKTSIKDRIPKPKHSASPQKKLLYSNLTKEFSLEGPGINGGLYLIDTRLITENTYTDICNLIIKYRSLFNGSDECAISLFFKEKLTLLPLSYNVYIRLYRMNQPQKAKGAILHFVGSACLPPWNEKSLYFEQWKMNLAWAENINAHNVEIEEIDTCTNGNFQAEEKYLKRKYMEYRLLRYPLSELRKMAGLV